MDIESKTGKKINSEEIIKRKLFSSFNVRQVTIIKQLFSRVAVAVRISHSTRDQRVRGLNTCFRDVCNDSGAWEMGCYCPQKYPSCRGQWSTLIPFLVLRPYRFRPCSQCMVALEVSSGVVLVI